MTRSIMRVANVVAALFLAAGRAEAQQTMSVTGHVTYRGAPVSGALVRFPQLGIERLTTADGRYSFLIPQASVRGQTATLTVRVDDRRIAYRPMSVELGLTGGKLVQDFALVLAEFPRAGAQRRDSTGSSLFDPLELPALSGSVSLPAALAGRVPGLDVRVSAVPGGTDRLQYRGPRTLVGSNQPLIVIDGLPVDNSSYSSASERFGLGGFDYGSPLQDVSLASIASVKWLSGAEAVAQYGGRAANGVIVVRTSNGGDLLGLTIAASQQVTAESPLRLPAFQNAYGQGLDGQFEFFNGRGGGINDNVDQSWGPALDGRPLQQASLSEARRAEVRLWQPRPNNVRDYFTSGRTTITTAAVQRGGSRTSFRVFVDDRGTRGLSPEHDFAQRDGGVNVAVHPSSTVSAAASAMFARTTNSNAPGTGFDESNPFAQFVRTGRQVDVAVLRSHLRDSTGQQISWSYSGHNNPWFAALENSNKSTRDHATGVASVTLTPTSWLVASALGGIDDDKDARRFSIASGWMGGFPSLTGAGDYSRGGLQRDDIAMRRTSGAVSLEGTRAINDVVRWTTGVGADHESLRQSVVSVGVDSGATLPANARTNSWEDHSSRDGAFARTALAFGDAGVVTGSVRGERTSLGAAVASTLYPGVSGSIDLARALPALRGERALNSAVLHGSWSRSAGERTPYALQSALGGGRLSGSVAPTGGSFLSDSTFAPEITTAAEAGITLALAGRRLSLGATLYSEMTDAIQLSVFDAAANALTTRGGSLSNRGIEAQASLRVGDARGAMEWSLAATAAHNTNQVETLDGADAFALGPSLAGLGVQARVGAPLGEFVGSTYLRDAATGALLLRNGLPLPDSVAGAHPWGANQPSWLLGGRTSFRFRRVTVAFRGDAHVGGSFFSGTKLWGSYAGTLAETAYRPDSGLLVAGMDADTRQPNVQHVSTQAYYHALATIQEPWMFSSTYAKLREARASLLLPTAYWNFPFESASIAIVGRNLFVWSRADGVDPEVQSGIAAYRGVEWGQLPFARSIGLQLSITP